MKKLLIPLLVLTLHHFTLGQSLNPDEKLLLPRTWKGKVPWINKSLESIDLNREEPAGIDFLVEESDFCMGQNNLIRVYGRGYEPERVFFDEHLPALFKRTLSFTKLDLSDGELNWIFTGDNGGFTVVIKENEIQLNQRYYDSYGLNAFHDDSIHLQRFPVTETVKASVKHKGTIEHVSVEVTHEMQVFLSVNGRLIARQLCLLDISRHQLNCTSKSSEICGMLLKPEIEEAEIEIFSGKKRQTILGFGGITSVPAYNLLSAEGKKLWWQYINDYNLLLHREYPIGSNLSEKMDNWDNLNDAVPHYYGDNFNNSEISDFEYIKKIKSMGGVIIFEFWHLPPWVVNTENTHSRDAKGNKRIPDLEKYCRAMVNYCQTSVNKTGNPPDILGIQNEVKQSAEMWQQMTLSLRKALDENGFPDVKIHMCNQGTLNSGIDAAKAFSQESDVWNIIDFAASNLYDYQTYYTHPDGYDPIIKQWNSIIKDKDFLSTEICINASIYQVKTYRTAFQLGQLYHKNMVDMNAIGIMYCWNILNVVQPTFARTRALFTIDRANGFIPEPSSYTLRSYGAFSRHLQKGMHRVETMVNVPDILVSAYTSGEQHTMIVLNRSSAPKRIEPNKGEIRFTHYEICSPYQQNRKFPLDSEEIVIEGGEIITFFN